MDNKKYIVKAGGFYTYVKNKRSGRGTWANLRRYTLKKTDIYTFTEDEAAAIIAKNNSNYMRMANAHMVEA